MAAPGGAPWIPAFAGMTAWEATGSTGAMTVSLTVIPAKAGIHRGGPSRFRPAAPRAPLRRAFRRLAALLPLAAAAALLLAPPAALAQGAGVSLGATALSPTAGAFARGGNAKCCKSNR